MVKLRDGGKIIIPFAEEGLSSQSFDFSINHVWMWELDYKERIDTFEWWCWRRLLRVPWTARKSNQSILEEISPGCSLEGLMLKLKLQYFGHLVQRTDSLEKTLMLGKNWRQEKKGLIEYEMDGCHHQCNGYEFEQTLGDGEGQGSLACYSPWGCKESDTTEWLNWIELIVPFYNERNSHNEVK